MSRDLTDVLHAFVDDQARASASTGPDPAQRARTVAALVRRRRTQRVGGLAAASVALLAAGAVAAGALSGPAPQPAVPEPSATASASPTPAVTATPSPSATEPPDQPVSWSRGLVDPFETSPRELWSITADELVPDWAGTSRPDFLDLSTGFTRGGASTISVDETVVARVGDFDLLDGFVVGLDAETGATRWRRSAEEGRRTDGCAGLTPDGLVVCTGTTAPGGEPEVQLLDPVSGEVARAYGLPFVPDSAGLAGTVLVVHAGTGSEVIDVHWAGVDVTTGDVVWSHVAAGRGEFYEVSDTPPVTTQDAGTHVRLEGYFYDLVIDPRTGEEVEPTVDPSVNDAIPVWAPASPTSVPVYSLWTQEDGTASSQTSTPLRALDPVDGSVLWELGSVTSIPKALVGNVLIVTERAASDGGTLAVDALTGEELWSAERMLDVVATDGTRLLLSDGRVVLLADGTVLAARNGQGEPFSASVGSPARFFWTHWAGGQVATLTLLGW